MKKIKSLSFFLMLFSVITFVSCETEPVDPVLSGGLNEGENPGTDPGTDPGTSQGDYWPMAINNQWVFSENGETLDPMKITGTENVGGNSYFKIDQFFTNAGTSELTGSAVMLLRKNGGDYSVRVSVNIPDQEGVSITVTPFEFSFLKDNLAAGESWTQTVTQTTTTVIPGFPMEIPPVNLTLKFTGTIVEKNATAQINGVTYTDVIKVKLLQETEPTMGMPAASVTTNLWFSKNVGPIKSVSVEEGFENNQELKSYILN